MPRSPFLYCLPAFAVVLVAACGDSSGPDTVTLAGVQPVPAAVNVAPSAPIMLTFSHPMMAGMEQYMDLHRGGVTGPTVPMNCAWNAGLTVLTCTPAAPLAPATQYTIHVGAGMTDAKGGMLQMDNWMSMGGEWATSSMMGATHAGQPVGMMGSGWTQGGHLGMLFQFTSA